jgi:myosin heavy subunit
LLSYSQQLTLPDVASRVLEISEKALEALEDLCQMEELHESLIMENLKRRFKDNTIYVCIDEEGGGGGGGGFRFYFLNC